MINPIENYVYSLDMPTRESIINSWDKFCEEGVIGDEPVRQYTEKMMEEIGSTDRVVFWMKELAFEIYKQAWNEVKATQCLRNPSGAA